MSRSTVRVLIAIAVVAVLAWLFLVPPAIIGQPEIVWTTANGIALEKGVLRMPIERTDDEEYELRAWVDWNADGTFDDDEKVASDIPFTPKKGDTQTVPVRRWPKDSPEGQQFTVRIAVFTPGETESSEVLETLADRGRPYDIGDVLDMSTVTKPDSAMKGDTVERPGTGTAPKHEGIPNTFANDTPDMKQRKDECAPTSAANSIIRMAGDNGRIDAIPRDPYALVDMLKGQMGWTPQNGVLIEDFSRGKDYVAKQLNLPIHSETYKGDSASVLDRIEGTLQGGGGTEMRMKQVVDGKAVGGHMVTVTNVVRTGQQVSVQIHDPLSPSGTDTYEVDSRTGELIGYPYMRGSLIITTGFLQTWDHADEHSIIDDLEPTRRPTVKAIHANGHYIPLSEVYVEEPGNCGAKHYHASRNGTAKALDGAMVSDVAPMHCGYGIVDETPIHDCSPDGATCSEAKK